MNHRLERSNTGFIAKVFANRKNYFLYGNTLFWVIILIESVVVNPETLGSFFDFTRALSPAITGFLTTTLLRFVFKRFKVHTFTLVPLTLVAFLYSISATLLWTYSFFVMGYIYEDGLVKVSFYVMAHLFEINYIAIALWSCLYLGYKVWEEWNNQKYQLAHERELLRSAQLETLKYQLNPHFLFNTLSSLRGLITIEPLKAREMVTHISEFLRYSLQEGKNNEVQLSKEIEIIKLYLNIEQVRYNEDLIVVYDVCPDAMDIMIPIFLIHPLVENAVKHGMQTSPLPLRITVRTALSEKTLIIEIVNTGRWFEKVKNGTLHGTGIGLQNVQRRLAHTYPGNHSFEIIKANDYVKVLININYPEL